MKQNLRSSVWRCCVVTLLFTSNYLTSFSQSETTSYFEAGITVGPSNFLGDLGGNMGRGTPFLKYITLLLNDVRCFSWLQTNEFFGLRLSALCYPRRWWVIIKPKGGLDEARKIRTLIFAQDLLKEPCGWNYQQYFWVDPQMFSQASTIRSDWCRCFSF